MMVPMVPSLIVSRAFLLSNATTGKGQEGGFLPLLALPLIMKVLEKRVRVAERRYDNINKNF